jgi:hypothetical protein
MGCVANAVTVRGGNPGWAKQRVTFKRSITINNIPFK